MPVKNLFAPTLVALMTTAACTTASLPNVSEADLGLKQSDDNCFYVPDPQKPDQYNCIIRDFPRPR